MMPPQMNVDIVRYKVFISGKTGVGKTALAARLAGLDLPKMHYETTDVTESDITHFQEVWGLPVFRVGGDVSAGLGEVAPLLNALAENLWHQDCMAASSVSISTQPALRETDSEIIV
ncbi:REM2- and Rab-like small GTPase 1 [Labeo rohita]|uniref:REM2-and Rab-like small GTPase 1 n=1 Tax=Labeo rohita TaxID=84645 RepID=A0A498L620_LABRO|nr:REM2- and Rab-like small GTPase 1 [Labeo rohita]